MNNQYDDGYTAADRALMRRESINRERQKAKADAMKQSMTKGIAAVLKGDQTDQVRKGLQKDMYAATERTKYGQIDAKLNKVASVGGATARGYQDEEVITGWEERPWERDDFDPWSD